MARGGWRVRWSLAAVGLCAGASAQASPLPKAGYYSELYYVLSASVSGGSGACVDPAGTYFAEEGFYPGPSKTGAREYRALSSASGLVNQINVFPVTPASGFTTWSGTYTTTYLPGGKPIKATFDTTYVFTDAASSVSTTTVTYPAPGGGTCTTNLQTNSIYTGQ